MIPQKPILSSIYSTAIRDPGQRIAKFYRKIARSTAEECWLWHGSRRQGEGYGVIGWKSDINLPCQVFYAHRVAWVLHHQKDIPEGYVIDHLCGNKACCNPAHLECVTQTINIDRYHDGRPETGTCKRGHPTQRGIPCKVCRDLTVKAWKEANPDRWRLVQQRSDYRRGKTSRDPDKYRK